MAADAATMQQAFRDSRASIRSAILKLDALISTITRAPTTPLGDTDMWTFIAVVNWLKVDPNNLSASLPTIQSARNLLDRNLNLRTSAGIDPPLQRGGPITLAGGVVTSNYHANTPGGADRGTDCGDAFFDHDGPKCRRDVITHEFFHILGIHHGGGALDGPTIRANITTPIQALDSADNLAQLVAQLTTHGGRTDACTRGHE